MSKRLYIYESVDVCDPGSEAYHQWGGLVVVTSGDPQDAVKPGTLDVIEGEYALPEPSHVFDVADDSPDVVVVFPDTGCC